MNANNPALDRAVEIMIESFKKGGKLLVCGNGGSACDSAHIVGELVKGFLKKRPLPREWDETMDHLPLQMGLPAIALPSLTGVNTAFSNDVDAALVYAQGVLALGRPGDVLLAISTSGNAVNVNHAAVTARALGLTVIALTGQGGGKLAEAAEIGIFVPEKETYKVQELHLPVYHYLCAAVEQAFFEN
jgi:D-sedoheptulose 7-phosphate isomerase